MPLAPLALALYLGALIYTLRRGSDGVRFLLLGVWLTFFVGFLLTPFANDPTARYLLPLYIPLALFTAHLLRALRAHWGDRVVYGLLTGLLLFNLAGNLQGVLRRPPGIATQFNSMNRLPHKYDKPLMAFLRAHNGTRGYSNYWVSYRLAFLSDEEIILTAKLPYKTTLSYTPLDDRYPPYNAMVADSPTVVYVTSNLPALDALLRRRFQTAGVTWQEHQIGPYHIFYNLSRKVSPDDIVLCACLLSQQSLQQGLALHEPDQTPLAVHNHQPLDALLYHRTQHLTQGGVLSHAEHIGQHHVASGFGLRTGRRHLLPWPRKPSGQGLKKTGARLGCCLGQ